MSYQQFDNKKTSSDSYGKLQSLKLTKENVEGKRILDIGCNEGYFAFKLSEMGAKEVVGLDNNKKWIEAAQKRNNSSNINFIYGDLSYLKTIEDNSFDIVLTLSAMHYMSNPEMRNNNDIPEFIIDVARILVDKGMWIFEGGVVQDKDTNEFLLYNRSIGDKVYHPTKNKIIEILNIVFSNYEYVGPSVNQSGDPVPRFVYYGIK
jgi:ubiquinone/menaquinone biosynthesis C-methylase UbiE